MRRPSQIGVGVAVVILAAGLVVTLLRPGTVETSVDDGPPVTPPESGSPVVAALRVSGGFSLFGLRFVDGTHTVEVQFTTGPGCSALLSSGDPWPPPHPDCATGLDLTGEVGGLGVTSTGRSLVGVVFPVPRECYEVLALGMPWPPGVPECREVQSGA